VRAAPIPAVGRPFLLSLALLAAVAASLARHRDRTGFGAFLAALMLAIVTDAETAASSRTN
jgi:hypothetical protein